jgi:GMP synthase-like glutamine amidotransferase
VTKVQRQERLTIKKPCPLTLDLKRNFVVMENYNHIIEELPQNFTIAASSPKYEYEIIQDMERPLFGMNFSPSALDGIRVANNFVKFVEVWEKYHK